MNENNDCRASLAGRSVVKAAFALLLTVGFAHAQATTLSVTDWSTGDLSVENVYSAGFSPTGSTFTATATGSGNPGTGLDISSSLPSTSDVIHRFVAFSGQTYDPGRQGAIESFDYSIDQIYVPPGYGGHGWGIGLKQGTQISFLNLLSGSNKTTWTTYSGSGITAADLNSFSASGLVQGLGTSTLDLSASGSVIQLGLVIYSGTGSSPGRYDTTRYDNFQVTLNHPVDEPASLALILAAMAGMRLARRGPAGRASSV